MTTNVMDRRNKIVSSDSRWSIDTGAQLFYVDDTGFDKIAVRDAAVMVCAGNAQFISDWKEWFRSPSEQIPPTESLDSQGNVVQAICISIIGKPDYTQLFSAGSYENYEDAAEFCGTGALYAKDCYSANGCATTAVISASRHDPMTGGAVKFAQVSQPFEHNLSSDAVSVADVVEQMKLKGMSMDKATGNVVKISDLQGKAADGVGLDAISASKLSAPSGQALRAWTSREKQDVVKVMSQILRSECQAKF